MTFDNNFHVQTKYRELEEGRKVIDLDDLEIVIGIQAQGIQPLSCITNGTKLKMLFYEDEALPKYQLISLALVGSLPEDTPASFLPKSFMDYYIMEIRAKRNWNQELAMMRSMNRPRS